MNIPLTLPVVIPLVAAAASLVAWGSHRVQRAMALGACLAELGVAIAILHSVQVDGIRVEQMGAWPAPFGITLVADLFSAMMILLSAVSALAVIVYSFGSMRSAHVSYGYYPLFSTLIMGVNGAFLTGDLFNLYVWFEVMLMSSFALLALGGNPKQLDASIKYLTINLVSSVLFLSGLGILYGVTGTLNMADLGTKLAEVQNPNSVTALAVLFLAAFGIKAGIFHLFFWLPASYHTPPVAISAIFAGLLTKVGVYSLIRVFTVVFTQNVYFTHSFLLLFLAVMTMVTGVLGAIAHNELRRIFSFQIICSTGFMVLGLALYTPLALAGSIFYIAHSVIVKTNLFLLTGIVQRLRRTLDLSQLGGMYALYPGLSVLFLISAFSLAGVPPLSGFFAKLPLMVAALESKSYLPVVAVLTASILTLYAMTKVWAEAFWKPAPKDAESARIGGQDNERGGLVLMMAPVVMLAIVTLGIGMGAGVFFQFALETAEQLLDGETYVFAVLGDPQ